MSAPGSLEAKIQDDEPKNIRIYRARKLRPCDNCRSRRKRCIIPTIGEPCSLCLRGSKACTFLYSRKKKSSSDPTNKAGLGGASGGSIASSIRNNEESSFKRELGPIAPSQVTIPDTTFQLAAHSQERSSSSNFHQPDYHSLADVITSFSENKPSGILGSVLSPTHELISSVRRARKAATPHIYRSHLFNPHSNQPYIALDDEAADDEELYLVGTASERDALVLNAMAGDDEDTVSLESRGQSRSAIPGLRIRKVSPNVSFVFYKSQPYGPEGSEEDAYLQLEERIGVHLASSILQDHSRADRTSPSALRCLCLTAGLIYTPTLRHLHHDAYVLTMRDFRRQSPRARLWTMQFYLTDLDGRESINPSGNFLTLGLAVSTARLLGLHEDCTMWSIPEWEKDLRSRLWWALLVYDKLSSLTFGRSKAIVSQRLISLPSMGQDPSPSLEAFVSLCELVTILEDLQPSSPTNSPCTCCHHAQDSLDRLSKVAYRLDQWKAEKDSRSLFTRCSPGSNVIAPGIRSLNLTYLGSVLMVVREAWDSVANDDLSVQIASQRSCLKSCEDIVDFLCGLTSEDTRGYWSSRLIMSSDRTDQSDNAIWQAALFALRRLISTMSNYQNERQWDVAQLALSRARYFIPLLARQASEFQVALLPLENALVDVPNIESLDEFLNSLVDMPGFENFIFPLDDSVPMG